MGRLCLLVMMLVLLNGYCCLGCWKQERIALLQIKVDINFPNGTSLRRWVDNETANCCDWKEIECSVDTGRVIQISLNETRDWSLGDWYFNASLFLPFKELRTLHLSGNSLVGWVENEGFERLSMLMNLQVVDLSYNNFNISILSRLLRLPSLKYLSLQSNNLEGSTHFNSSERLSRLNNLEVLDLSLNNLNGSILSFLSLSNLEILHLSYNWSDNSTLSFAGGLSSLKSLDLSANKIKGTVDMRELDALTNLEVLDLSSNEIDSLVTPKDTKILKKLKVLRLRGLKKISRNLLQSLGAFSSLKTLNLGLNTFEGTITAEGMIPKSLSLMTSLVLLDVSSNNLTGMLPRWLGNMTYLLGIVMSKNHLQGSIPTQFCKLDILEFVDLSENNLSGSIPSCLNRSRITHVYLNKNRLEGPLTRAFYNNSSLVTLDLSHNNLTDTIPKWIGSLSALSILLLKGNQFKGRIPIQLCHLNRLSIMDFSHNNLFGPIPHCLGKINMGSTTGQSNAMWSIGESYIGGGYLVSYMESTSLIGLHSSSLMILNEDPLSEVQLQVEFTTKRNSLLYNGSILNYMSGIDLSCNQLAGEIPLELGNLSDIRALNLSHNNLTGTIPVTLSKLKQVESLDLSYNNLNGRIPTQLIELNALAVFSVAHNNLSGALPERKAQFGTFEETSYEGNPLLCGPPLHKSCTKNRATSPMRNVSNGEVEEDGFVDMDAFYITFVVSYIIVLLGIAIVLYINPYWRQAWFYFIEVYITSR
ncbi:hypothetical protein F0562_008428 [Nyssa sinensis]|uniref:Leucine-rich repeat-containing N-terminal plant-type domain-containing protein n=1 Tax=Nyssa sinensis TaxID=561372 RepID=A0A5J5A7V4_9ASTE|nr:hypothetical protein F0562_008428 [Nyssa sinensis]